MKFRYIFRLRYMCLLCLTVLVGCSKDYLDKKPNTPTEEGYFINELDFTRGVIGVYAKQSDFYWYNGSQNSTTMPVFFLMGDDITAQDQDEFEIFGPLQPGSGRVGYFYRSCYQLVSRANIMLEKIAEVEDGIYTTPNLKNNHKGEVLFLRGHAYFLLWNYFGTSPLITERITEVAQFQQPNSTGNALLDQAIKDFTEAATLLPTTWDAANRGRVTANAANAYLGKALVFRATVNKSNADYQAAIAAFAKVSGVSLVPNFNDNFAVNTENNAESLFEFQATQASQTDNAFLPNDFNNVVGSLSAFWGFYSGHNFLFGKSRHFATTKFLNAFEPGDIRRDSSINPTDRTMRKYTTRNLQTQQGVGSVNNVRILRFADVLLLRAEALVQSGGSTEEAIGYINQVRTRARTWGGGSAPANFPTTETNRTTIMQWIMDERLRELGGEGHRWPDIRRWHIAGIIQLNNAFFSSTTTTMSFTLPRHLLLPIPTNETDLNPNITQNTGY